jgi:hypothetical protein
MSEIPEEVQAMDWDSEVDTDSLPFVTLPDNTDVTFEVTKLEKCRTSDGKYPMAKLQLLCQALDGSGQTTVYENLVLNTKCAWKLGEFFRAIGQRQHGEKIVPNWGAVEGAKGQAILGVEKWTKRTGEVSEGNKVKRFLDPADEPAATEPTFG